jgi:hypothetical protein
MSAQINQAELDMAETAAPAGDARPETAGETGTPAAAADAQPQPASEAKTFWTLKYGDQIYGPYAHEAMEKYIGEGRIVAQSVIAPAGSEEWKFAKDVSAFAVHFGGAPAQPEAETGLQASTQPDRRANRRAADTGDDRPAYGPAKGQIDRRKRPESNNFVIIAEIKSHHGPELERAPRHEDCEQCLGAECQNLCTRSAQSAQPAYRPLRPALHFRCHLGPDRLVQFRAGDGRESPPRLAQADLISFIFAATSRARQWQPEPARR